MNLLLKKGVAVGLLAAFLAPDPVLADDKGATAPTLPQTGAPPASGSCQFAKSAPIHEVAPQNARGGTSFALDLLRGLAGHGGVNAAVSPFGVSKLLAVLDLGADAKMKAAIARTLHAGRSPGSRTVEDLRKTSRLMAAIAQQPAAPFAAADGLFVERTMSLSPGISDLARAEAGIAIQKTDFNDPDAIALINKWAEERTGGRIKTVLEPASHPSLVAVSTFAFKDCWRLKFDPSATSDRTFTRLDHATVQRSTMLLDEQELAFAQRGRFVSVELPYAQGDFAMTLVTTMDAPAPPTAFADAADILSGSGFRPKQVRLTLPKFTSTGDHDLLGLLSSLGLAPGLASKTQFSGFAKGLSLSALRQKLFIAVDEAGTEATAATIGEMSRGAEPGPSPTRISFDKPFIYALKHRATGTILMAGYVADPGS